MASKKTIEQVWEKAQPFKRQNPDVFRRDPKGNKIRWGSYGIQGEYGWEIDHKNPKAKGGSDKPQNLQPLHWEENREKSDKYPSKK
ncbi:MAG: HNH endonuclease [Elusimicrobia bacterium HGW-Elusimicrobia-2]|nr:MAG: HNH endonuclease [Elusimicrobia bacterium HGW-Elusimicrobia-2]